MTKQYAERDAFELDQVGGHYMRHVMAMTAEQLHSKSDIAAELAWRDSQIAELQQKLDVLEDKLSRAQDWAIGVDTERMHFIEKCSELSAENAALKQWVKETDELWVNDCDLDSHLDSVPQTPATDTYLNSVRAEGVDLFVKDYTQKLRTAGGAHGHHEEPYKEMADHLEEKAEIFTEQLRSGTHDTADKAG